MASQVDTAVFVFGALAVAAFWTAIHLCRSARGKRWYGVAARVAGAVALIGFGVLMIFYTAFGADGN